MNSDKDSRNKVGAGQPASTLSRMERMPPMQMLLYLSMIASTVLFVVLAVAYAQTRFNSAMPQGIHPFPRYFSISTIVLLVSSYTISQARRLYQQDDVAMLTRCLGATLLLAAIFVGLQGLGWRELIAQGVFFNGEASGTYVYLLSALHILHLLGAFCF
ncbi:cytochrome c oxidase subunit 3 [Hymenobacter qilianensis]|uniref:cytochrome c oxidase subunit 3 n=1 Tax=Hymenobacter qilianensis TaxID=1385715 RepID=UPI001CB8A04C|nr:cytochrome c oxidase subunit III [Hymenobacter qilianensis]